MIKFDQSGLGPAKLLRKSYTPAFGCKINFLLCKNCCRVKKCPQHSDCWKKSKGILCHTTDFWKGKKSFKFLIFFLLQVFDLVC